MNSDELKRWADSYNRDYEARLHEIEQTLHKDFREQQYVTQHQLRQVVEWKLDNQIGRQLGNLERVNSVPDSFIRLVSEAAFEVEDPKIQLKTLSSIPGIGSATATVILAFYDPENYAVGDRYMVDILLGESRQMRVTDYPKILSELQNRAPTGIDLRTVEKAYYQRYREQNGLT